MLALLLFTVWLRVAESQNPCPAGQYQVNGTGLCSDCLRGSYNDGLTNYNFCSFCLRGYIAASTGASVCDPCVVGKIAALTGQSVCTDCVAGVFQANTGQSMCSYCQSGEYQDLAGQTFCKQCAPGSYQNQYNSTTCRPCAAGTAAPTPKTQLCTSCAIGTYSGAGASVCTDCAPGTASAATGVGSCNDCLAGTSATNAGSTSCDNCTAGKFTANPRSTVCTLCAVGTFQATEGLTSCDQCTPGTGTATPGLTVCSTCGVGTASSTGTCDNCVPGTYSDAPGLVACKTCLINTFTDQPGRTVCSPCQSGYVTTGPGAPECYMETARVQSQVYVTLETTATCAQLNAMAADLRTRLAGALPGVLETDIVIDVQGGGCTVTGRRLLATVSFEVTIRSNATSAAAIGNTLGTQLDSIVNATIVAVNAPVTSHNNSAIVVDGVCSDFQCSSVCANPPLCTLHAVNRTGAKCSGSCTSSDCCEDPCVATYRNFGQDCDCPSGTPLSNCTRLCASYNSNSLCRSEVTFFEGCKQDAQFNTTAKDVLDYIKATCITSSADKLVLSFFGALSVFVA